MHFGGCYWGFLMAAGVSLSSQIGWGGWQKQRAASRTLVVLSATVHFQGKSHVGLIRDISRDGLFVYSDFLPKVGDIVRSTIRPAGTRRIEDKTLPMIYSVHLEGY